MSSRALAAALLALCALAVALGGGTGASATSLVGGAAALLALAVAATGRLRPPPLDATVLALAWSGLGLVSTLWSVQRDATLDACITWLAAALVFLLAAGGLTRNGREVLLAGLAVLGALVACCAIAATPIGARARLPFTNPNHLAAWLVLPAALAACEVLRASPAERGRREAALLWFGLFGMVGAGVAATQSLGAILAAAGGVGGLALLRALPPRHGARVVAAIWLGVALVLAAAPSLLPSLLPPHDGMGESSPGLRWQIYAAAGRLGWEATPWGVGLGAFGTAFATFRPEGVPYAPIHAHAEVLQAWAELGLPFVLLFAASVVLFAARARSGIRRDRFVWGAATALLALGLHALVDFPLQVPAIAFAGAALAGTLWSAWTSTPVDAPGPSRLPTRRGVVALSLTLGLLAGSLGFAHRAERRAEESLAAGRFGDAEAEARAGLRVRPERAALWNLVADACEAQARLGGGGPPAIARAVAARERAVAVSPLDAQSRGALAGTKALAGDLDGALAAADAAARFDPRSPAPRVMQAQLLLAAGRGAEAAAAVHAALERHPRAADGLLEALLRATGDPELVARAAPDEAATRRSAGLVLGRAGFSRLAARALARALELAPDDADVALEAARHLARSGDPVGAEAVLSRTLARVPGEARLTAALARVREQVREGASGGTS